MSGKQRALTNQMFQRKRVGAGLVELKWVYGGIELDELFK